MTEEVIEQQDSQPVEELDLEVEETQETTTEADVDWKAKAEKLEQKNKQLFARLKKQPKDVQPITKKEEIGELGTRLSNLELLEKKRQFGYENGLSPDETDRVFRFNSNPTKETLEDEFVKAGIEALRKKRKVADATPSPTGRSSKVDGKTFAEMKPEERNVNFDKLRKNILGK